MNASTRNAIMRSQIEQWRDANTRKHGVKDTADIDAELAGATLDEQVRAWRELYHLDVRVGK